MKNTTKLFAILCAMLALFALSSCKNEEKTVTGEKQTDVQEEQPQNVEKPQTGTDEKSEGKGGITVKKSENPLTLIQSIKASVRTDTSATTDTADIFLKSLKNGDTETISSLAGGEAAQFDFIKSVKISDYTMLPFNFSQSEIKARDESGFYTTSLDMYIVMLNISESDSTDFPTGTQYYLMLCGEDGVSEAMVHSFVPFSQAESELFTKKTTEKYEYCIDQFSSLYSLLSEGKNDASSFDFSTGSHLITHLLAYYTDTLPPYSYNEVNDFIYKAFDGNRGITTDTITIWSNYYANTNGLDYSDDSLYTDFDKKILGCSYGHGGNTSIYTIKDVKESSTGKVVTVDYFADFAKLTRSKTLTFYFNNDTDEGYPCLAGITVDNVTGYETASFSV